MPVEKQILLLFGGIFPITDKEKWRTYPKGYFLREVAIEDIARYERELLSFVDTHQAGLLQEIAAKKKIDDELEQKIFDVLSKFRERFAAAPQAA
jgi:F0F1-type ATP synthase alpha subunit